MNSNIQRMSLMVVGTTLLGAIVPLVTDQNYYGALICLLAGCLVLAAKYFKVDQDNFKKK